MLLVILTVKKLLERFMKNRASFNYLLRAVPARSALFERLNAFFSTKNSKNTCRLGGCSVLNALNLEKCWVKCTIVPFYCTLLPFFGYNARMPLFSRIRPEKEVQKIN